MEVVTLNFDDAVAEAFRLADAQGLANLQLKWNGKPFGIVSFAKKKYYIHRIPSLHLFRKWRSYGVSKSILEQLRLYGIDTVSLFERGASGDERFGIRVERFFNHTPLLERTNEVSPFDKQLHIPIAEWIKETGRWKPEDIHKSIEPEVVRINPE